MVIHYYCWQTKCHKICHTNHMISGSKNLTTLTVVFSKWLLYSVLSMLMALCACKRAMWLRRARPRCVWAKFSVSAWHGKIAQLLQIRQEQLADFCHLKKKKKHSLGMHFCRNLPTSAADLKFSVKEAYLIYISNSQWYWSSLISIGNNKSCSRRRDGLKFNNVYILQIVIGASCLRLFWPILHLFSACSLNYISAEKLFREKNKELRDFGDSTEGLHFTLILFL